jgi:hypothetical protein
VGTQEIMATIAELRAADWVFEPAFTPADHFENGATG